jgi:hypothetical protein
MRFIIHELPYEKPVASGQWRYMRDGLPTGAIEQWRLSDAVDGFRFLRVDLDARDAYSGRSYLYHLTMDEKGRALQLKYRLWDHGLEIIGNVLLEEEALLVTRETREKRHEDVLTLPRGYAFWFPATAGLSLLAGLPVARTKTAVTLRTTAAEADALMGPLLTTLDISLDELQPIELMGKTRNLRPLTIRWQDQERRTWLDENNWPLVMKRGDGLTAVQTRAIRVQRITGPGEGLHRH